MDHAAKGEIDAALPLFHELEPLRDLMVEMFMVPLITRTVYNLAPIKYWLELLGFKMGACRPPLAPFASESDKARIRTVLLECGVIDEPAIAAVVG